jgi:hypothetical protein
MDHHRQIRPPIVASCGTGFSGFGGSGVNSDLLKQHLAYSESFIAATRLPVQPAPQTEHNVVARWNRDLDETAGA